VNFLAYFLMLFVGILALMYAGFWLVTRRQVDVNNDIVEPRIDAAQVELEKRLRQAGLAFTPSEFDKRARMLALGVGCLGFAMGGFGFGGIVFGCAFALMLWYLRGRYIDLIIKRRAALFDDQLCDALGMMANGVKSGQSLLQTFELIATDFQHPLRGEMNEVLQEVRMGVPLDAALGNWVRRIPSEDLEIATTAMIIQRQTGGNIAEVLDTVATTIRARNKLFKQIRALTAQGRASGWVMAFLPVGLFLILYIIAPARTGLLISHPLGLLGSTLGALSIGFGAYIISRIVTIDV
jgi:tight adherence protein B